jgi:hypothetical protein
MCWTPLSQTNTNNVNKTCALIILYDIVKPVLYHMTFQEKLKQGNIRQEDNL